MKKAIILFSERFPAKHKRAGEPTRFRDSINSGIKKHTIRENTDWWSEIVKSIQKGEKYLSVRSWDGRPYNSTQTEWVRVENVGVQRISMVYTSEDAYPQIWIDGKKVSIHEVATNDGLSVNDFTDWFFGSSDSNTYEGIIIHLTDFRY